MVTPEMLLFLAERMGLQAEVDYDHSQCPVYASNTDESHSRFNPATDDAQFGRLMVWAAMNGHGVTMTNESCCCYLTDDWTTEQWADHDSTPDSIRAAAVVAICRALGYEGEKE